MKKFWLCIAVVLLCLPVLASCGGFINDGDILGGGGTVDEAPAAWENEYAQDVEEIVDNITFADISLDLPDDAVEVKGETEIKASGNYVLSGSIILEDSAQIKVSAKNVVLYLNGVTITKAGDKKVINCKKDTDTVIVLVEGTQNTITTTHDDVDAIGSDAGLTILGSGSLTVSATDDAISADATLKVVGATINATAWGGQALKGESIIIKDANIVTNTAGKDGVHAEIDYDAATEVPTFGFEKGFVYIENSTLNLTSSGGGDGISADTFVYILSGNFTIKTNGGAPATITETSSDNGEGKGIKVGAIDYILKSSPDTEIDLTNGDYTLYIKGGAFNINANDDALHSDAYLFITGGTFNIASGDDGIHSEKVLQISGGTITIQKCYEGIESAKVEISGGVIALTSKDDGINAADGTTNRPGVSNSNCYIIISGGNITVNASGDGIDSNGTVLISGGKLYVQGPVSGGDASLDSDGGILISGGELFAVGSYGMVETPARNSTQYVVSFATQSDIAAGTYLTLVNSDGENIAELTAAKACRSVIISSPDIEKGKTYYIYAGSSKLATFTVSSTITTVGSSASSNNPGGRPR